MANNDYEENSYSKSMNSIKFVFVHPPTQIIYSSILSTTFTCDAAFKREDLEV